MNHTRWGAWCVVVIVCHGSFVDAQTETLQWKLAPGNRFEVTLAQTTNATTSIDSREKTNNGSTTIIMDWNVIEIAENGDATIEQSLSAIRLTTGNPALPAQAVSYDTSSDQKISKLSKKLMGQVTPLIGMKFLVVMSPQGEIKEVILPEESTELLNRLPDTMQLRRLFSESGLKELQGASSIVLPNRHLDEGDSWSVEQPTPTSFGTYNRKRTYTLVGERTIEGRRIAEFSLATTMEPLPETTSAKTTVSESGTLQGEMTMSEGSGTLLMDIEDGYFFSSVIKNEARTEKLYREKTINTTVTNEVTMTVSKK